MRELDTILAQYEELKSKGLQSVLATVVHVEGSSYRRAGARMLIDEYGAITGAISGGCLEGDALKKALLALHQSKNKLITYDTSDEDDAVIGAQLGCNGIIQVLFEPIDIQDENNVCEFLKLALKVREPLTIVILFDLKSNENQLGTCFVAGSDKILAHKNLNEELLTILKEQSQVTLKNAHHTFIEIDASHGSQQAFIQYHQPSVKLVIVGAGNDAQILSQLADISGYEVIITDGRSTHANEERFLGSCQIIVTQPEKTLETITIDSRTCFVLMSHNYNYDLAVLKLLLPKEEIPYIGILGPLKKYERMCADLKAEGFVLTDQILNKIHAPVGLEIGAETPAEIGLSILAEIQAVLTGSSGRPLKEKQTSIHEHDACNFKKVQA